MWRFILKSGFFIAVGVLLDIGLGVVAEWRDPPHKREAYWLQQLRERADEIEVINCGNSQAIAVQFEAMGIPGGYNVWRDGMDIFEVDFRVRALMPELPALKTVLMNISVFTLHRDNRALTPNRAFLTHPDYAALLKANPDCAEVLDRHKKDHEYGVVFALDRFSENEWRQIGEVRKRLPVMGTGNAIIRGREYRVLRDLTWGWIGGDLFSAQWARLPKATRTDHGYRVLYPIPDPPANRRSIRYRVDQYGVFNDAFHSSTHSRAVLRDQAEARGAPRHLYMQADMLANRPDIPVQTVGQLKSLVAFLQSRGIDVVFYTPPCYERYMEVFDRETVRYMREAMGDLERECGTTWLDFVEDPRFCSRHEYFSSSDHLNLTGAAEFSRVLAGELRSRGLLPETETAGSTRDGETGSASSAEPRLEG